MEISWIPWAITSFIWLIGYSALLGPIAGIMICDYFIIRRTRLDVDALYDPQGRYAGVNWVAMVALVLGGAAEHSRDSSTR